MRCAVLCASNIAISTTTTQQFLILLHSTAMGLESAVEKCRLHIHDGDMAPPKEGDCSNRNHPHYIATILTHPQLCSGRRIACTVHCTYIIAHRIVLPVAGYHKNQLQKQNYKQTSSLPLADYRDWMRFGSMYAIKALITGHPLHEYGHGTSYKHVCLSSTSQLSHLPQL